jgi:hypothetical protein
MPAKPKPLPSMETLTSLFEFKDGVLYNKPDRPYPAKAGQPVGYRGAKDYQYVDVNRQKYSVHRVAFYMHHGWCPDEIDHINGNPSDNRIENLRPATQAQNAQNRALLSTNKTGYKGVRTHKRTNRFQAQIWVKRKYIYLGTFDTKELAAEFLELAREMLHGDYANHGTFRSI